MNFKCVCTCVLLVLNFPRGPIIQRNAKIKCSSEVKSGWTVKDKTPSKCMLSSTKLRDREQLKDFYNIFANDIKRVQSMICLICNATSQILMFKNFLWLFTLLLRKPNLTIEHKMYKKFNILPKGISHTVTNIFSTLIMLLIGCIVRGACSQLKGIGYWALETSPTGDVKENCEAGMCAGHTAKLTCLPKRTSVCTQPTKDLYSSVLCRETFKKLQLHSSTCLSFLTAQ